MRLLGDCSKTTYDMRQQVDCFTILEYLFGAENIN